MRTFISSLLCVLLAGCSGPNLSLDKARIQTVQQSPIRPVKPAVVYVEPEPLVVDPRLVHRGSLEFSLSVFDGGCPRFVRRAPLGASRLPSLSLRKWHQRWLEGLAAKATGTES